MFLVCCGEFQGTDQKVTFCLSLLSPHLPFTWSFFSGFSSWLHPSSWQMFFITSFIRIIKLGRCYFIVFCLWGEKKTDWLIERMNVDRFYIIHVNNQEASLKSLRMIETLFLYCSDISTMTNFHTYGTLSWFSCNAPPLDSRQTLTTAHSTAGGTVRTDKHCRSSSRPQLQSACGWFGLKVLLAKMLAAEVRVGCGDPLGAGALHLLLPFAKLLSVLGEFKQCHTIFCSFATSIGHTVVGHPVLCSQEDHECLRV